MVIAESAGDNVIHDHAVFSTHHAVPHRTDRKIVPVIGVDEIEQFDDIRPMQIELAQRSQVDDADIGTDVENLGRRVAVPVWSNPLSGDHVRRTVFFVPQLNR